MSTQRMHTNRSEDKPLLMSVKKRTDDDYMYIDDKYVKSNAAFKRWKYASKGNSRGRSMVMGAASVLKSWPDHLAMCWVSALAACVVVIVLILTLESRMGPSAHQKFTIASLQDTCVKRHPQTEDNGWTNIFVHVIINEDESFHSSNYFGMFKRLQELHPYHLINIFVLQNDTFELSYKRNTRFKDWEVYNNQMERPKFFDTPSSEKDWPIGRRNHWNHEELQNYPNINVVRSTFSMYFLHSPLRYKWRILPPELMPMVFRVLTLWEWGGITMPWPMLKDKTDGYRRPNSEDKLKIIVDDLKRNPKNTLGFGMNATELLKADLGRYVDLAEDITMEYLKEDDFEDPKPRRKITLDSEQDAPALTNEEKKAMFNMLKNNNFKRNSDEEDEDSDDDESSSSSSSSESYETGASNKTRDMVHHRPADPAHHRHHYNATKNKQKLTADLNSDMDHGTSKAEIERLLNNSEAQKRLAELRAKKAKQEMENKNGTAKDDHKHHHHKHHHKKHEEPVTDIPQEDVPRRRVKRELQNTEDVLLEEPVTDIPQEDVPHKRVKRELQNSEDILLGLNDIPKKPISFPAFMDATRESFGDDWEDDSKYSSSEYESEYYTSSDYSYSGLNSPYVFQANTRNRRWLGEVDFADSSVSSDYDQEPELSDLPDGIIRENLMGLDDYLTSEEYFKSKNFFSEEKVYVKRRVHDNVNVFSLPPPTNLIMDRFGYYFSTKRPCHAFLGELISSLQSSYSLKDAETVMQGGMSSFCKGRKTNNCVGISLL